jgi:hypothetical protein
MLSFTRASIGAQGVLCSAKRVRGFEKMKCLSGLSGDEFGVPEVVYVFRKTKIFRLVVVEGSGCGPAFGSICET